MRWSKCICPFYQASVADVIDVTVCVDVNASGLGIFLQTRLSPEKINPATPSMSREWNL
ncbi:hypothetical protein [Moraxella caprae]|uniref:hypothetical protein n=1 Tax=Moraxella caprae TaxID=90240 RepID=UPI0015588B63|nr:hypothetical protein [Moraxella caprae]